MFKHWGYEAAPLVLEILEKNRCIHSTVTNPMYTRTFLPPSIIFYVLKKATTRDDNFRHGICRQQLDHAAVVRVLAVKPAAIDGWRGRSV